MPVSRSADTKQSWDASSLLTGEFEGAFHSRQCHPISHASSSSSVGYATKPRSPLKGDHHSRLLTPNVKEKEKWHERLPSSVLNAVPTCAEATGKPMLAPFKPSDPTKAMRIGSRLVSHAEEERHGML